tara:strand:+ start:357 stop:1358 length:1002 start_codon:yes stop_codon:yes gene_type:complete
MSDLLHQAIVEAETLREAALKSAEDAVIEKYSHQIKEAVAQILDEQPEYEADPMQQPEEEPDIMKDVPVAGEEPVLCIPVPETEEGDEVPPDEVAEPADQTVVTLDLDAMLDDLDQDTLQEEEELEEEIDLDEEVINEIVESLTVDIDPTASASWAGMPNSVVKHKKEELLAMLQDDKHKEEFEAIQAAVKELQKENKDLKKSFDNSVAKNKEANERITKLTEALMQAKEVLEESNVVNAKLLYKVKVFENVSLNERQKSKIVESLSNAMSVEEAKIMYDTLQSSVGSTKRHPESLSEAVNSKTSSGMILSARKEQRDDSATSRWKTLAGIDK